MKLLSDSQLESVTGGGVWLWLGIVGFIIFLAGVFEGFTNPGRCNNG